MSVTETKNQDLQREYKIKISSAEIKPYYEAEINKASKNMKLPGFRQGKIPLDIVKKHHHKEITAAILQDVIEKNTVKLFEERNINPVQQPVIEIESYEEGKDLIYNISVEIFPEIEIPNMSDIEIERISADIQDEDIDKTVAEIANNNKEYTESVDGNSEYGQAVLIDYEGKIDSIPFEGGKAEDHKLVLGSKTFIEGFEEQLIGCKKNDELNIKVTFPDQYHVQALAGKEAEFCVKIKDILASKESHIDDDLAERFGFKNLSEFKESIKAKLIEDVNEISRNHSKKELFDILEQKCQFLAPQSLYEKEFNTIWSNYQKSPESNSSTKTKEESEFEFKKLAKRRVILGILIAEIGRIEKVSIEQSDIQKALMKQARQFAGQENIVMDYYKNNPQALEHLKGPILEDKVVDSILSKVNFVNKSISLTELLELVKKGDL